MDDEMNQTFGLLKALADVQNLDPKDKLPCLPAKDIKKTINANKDKLTIIFFIESTSPLINLIHSKLSQFPKETRMALGYYVDILQDESVINNYQLQQKITTILFKDGKEIQRFAGLIDDDCLTYIKDHIPQDPFGGGGHKITPMDPVDYEKYLQSVRRPKPESPPPQPKKTKHSRFDDFAPPSSPPPQPQVATNQLPQAPAFPIINPFTDEFNNLKQSLIDNNFNDDEIFNSFIAGCGDKNECMQYIENIRNNRPNIQKLTYPGFKIDDLSAEQKEIYDNNVEGLDRLEILYVLLYTQTKDEDEFMEYIDKAQNHELSDPVQAELDPVQAELNRIMGIPQPATIQPQTNFSRTAPQPDLEFLNFQKIAEQEIKKEMAEAKKKRNEELMYRQRTKKAIEENRRNMLRERESSLQKDQLSKTAPIKPIQSSSSKPQEANKKVTIRFRLPNGSNAQYEFEPTDTFDILEKKLKDQKHITEEDVIEFNVMPAPRIWRKDFGSQLQEKNIRGKVMISIIILPPQSPPQEAPENQE